MSHGRFLLKFSCSSIVGKTTQKSHFQFIQTLLLDFGGVVDDSLDILFAVKVFPFECVFALSGGEVDACLPGDIKRYTEGFLEILETLGDGGEFFCHIFVQWFYSSARKRA